MNNFRFGLLADIHAELFQNLAVLREDLLTDRSEEIAEIIREAFRKMVASGITHCFILGDLQDKRNQRTDAINLLIRDLIMYGINLGLKIIILTGNHDQAVISGKVHAFESFKEFCEVIDTPTIKTYGGFEFLMCPFEEYKGTVKSIELLLKRSKSSNRILLAHAGIQNAVLSGFDRQSKDPVTIEELQMDSFIACYFGHYHLPQDVGKNGVYVGSPCQHSLKDKPAARGYMEVELALDNSKWRAYNTRVELSSPKFIEIPVEKYQPENYVGKHYLKITGCKRNDLKRLELDSNVFATTGEKKEQVVDENKVINAELSGEDMIKKYVLITDKNRRNHKRLIELGREMLNA
jgi:DNA repair exonuclease SbcCD nuclease subunit